MQRHLLSALIVTLIPLVSADLLAQAPAKPARVRSLYGVSWHDSLDSALVAAKKTQRPVVWLRMLGDLAGKS